MRLLLAALLLFSSQSFAFKNIPQWKGDLNIYADIQELSPRLSTVIGFYAVDPAGMVRVANLIGDGNAFLNYTAGAIMKNEPQKMEITFIHPSQPQLQFFIRFSVEQLITPGSRPQIQGELAVKSLLTGQVRSRPVSLRLSAFDHANLERRQRNK